MKRYNCNEHCLALKIEKKLALLNDDHSELQPIRFDKERERSALHPEYPLQPRRNHRRREGERTRSASIQRRRSVLVRGDVIPVAALAGTRDSSRGETSNEWQPRYPCVGYREGKRSLPRTGRTRSFNGWKIDHHVCAASSSADLPFSIDLIFSRKIRMLGESYRRLSVSRCFVFFLSYVN